MCRTIEGTDKCACVCGQKMVDKGDMIIVVSV